VVRPLRVGTARHRQGMSSTVSVLEGSSYSPAQSSLSLSLARSPPPPPQTAQESGGCLDAAGAFLWAQWSGVQTEVRKFWAEIQCQKVAEEFVHCCTELSHRLKGH